MPSQRHHETKRSMQVERAPKEEKKRKHKKEKKEKKSKKARKEHKTAESEFAVPRSVLSCGLGSDDDSAGDTEAVKRQVLLCALSGSVAVMVAVLRIMEWIGCPIQSTAAKLQEMTMLPLLPRSLPATMTTRSRMVSSPQESSTQTSTPSPVPERQKARRRAAVLTNSGGREKLRAKRSLMPWLATQGAVGK